MIYVYLCPIYVFVYLSIYLFIFRIWRRHVFPAKIKWKHVIPETARSHKLFFAEIYHLKKGKKNKKVVFFLFSIGKSDFKYNSESVEQEKVTICTGNSKIQ